MVISICAAYHSTMEGEPEKEDLRAWLRFMWDDIHHSRNQEWKCLQIVLWIFLGLMGLSTFEEVRQRALFFSIAAMATSLIGLGITWRHRLLFNETMYYVNGVMGQLGINFESYRKKYEEHMPARNWFSRFVRQMGKRHIGPFRVGCTSSLIAAMYLMMFLVSLGAGLWSLWLKRAF